MSIDSEDAITLSNDELVDTRDGYTYRVVAYHIESDSFFVKYTGVRAEDWFKVYQDEEQDQSFRYEYADQIASLCKLYGVEIPDSITAIINSRSIQSNLTDVDIQLPSEM